MLLFNLPLYSLLKSNSKKRTTTKPKRNTGFRAKSNGLCIFMMSLNLMDLALDK